MNSVEAGIPSRSLDWKCSAWHLPWPVSVQFNKANVPHQIFFYWLFPTVQLKGGNFRDKLSLINLLDSAHDHKNAVKYLIFSIYCWVYNNSILIENGVMQANKKNRDFRKSWVIFSREITYDVWTKTNFLIFFSFYISTGVWTQVRDTVLLPQITIAEDYLFVHCWASHTHHKCQRSSLTVNKNEDSAFRRTAKLRDGERCSLPSLNPIFPTCAWCDLT